MKPRRVRVVWDDAHHLSGWHSDDEIDDKPARIDTTAWLVRRAAKHLVIALDRSDDGQWNGVSKIPLECVRKVKRL